MLRTTCVWWGMSSVATWRWEISDGNSWRLLNTRCTRNTIWKGQQWRGRRAKRKSRKRSQHWRCDQHKPKLKIQLWRREKFISMWRTFRTTTLSKMEWRSPSERRPRANWWKHSLQMFSSSSSRFQLWSRILANHVIDPLQYGQKITLGELEIVAME